MYLQPTIFLLYAKNYMLPCLNKKLFGFECPGCGMQRSVSLIFQGEFLAAFTMYPAIYPLFLLFSFLLVNNFRKIKHANQIIITLGIVSVATILTNYLFKLLQ
ncbi:DUF2752 domain-containing protein [Flagellimonas aquimarina]|uniref:DUF2752 domain-containing protein n=2 Tax=Flagellimonas aquimarina TaxID=2201895 RepID=A0A316L028_9FLAO|nr:DUF2752 domain-containing protein [Allomuricauda koreensis]